MQFYAIFLFLPLAIRQSGRSCHGRVSANLFGRNMAAPSEFPGTFTASVQAAGVLSRVSFAKPITANSKRDRVGLQTLEILLTLTQVQLRKSAIWVIMMGLVALLLTCDVRGWLYLLQHTLRAALDNSVMRVGWIFLFGLSFSPFLFIHPSICAFPVPGIFILPPHERTLLFWIAVALPTVATAFIIHRFIEQPGIEMEKEWSAVCGKRSIA